MVVMVSVGMVRIRVNELIEEGWRDNRRSFDFAQDDRCGMSGVRVDPTLSDGAAKDGAPKRFAQDDGLGREEDT